MKDRGGNGRRTFEEIRHLILLSLFSGRKTINQISNEINVNWRTVENHMTYLVGKGLIKEVFSSEYVRIFEITKEGKQYISTIIKEEQTYHIQNNEKEVIFTDNIH